MSQTRNLFIDFLKGALILLVVVGHLIQYLIYKNQEFWSDPIFVSIYMFHMPLFMGIGGFLSYQSISKCDFLGLVIAKSKLYVIPILSWAAINVAIEHNEREIASWQSVLIKIFKLFYSGHWFLWAMFLSIIATALVMQIKRRRLILYFLSSVVVLLLPEKGNIVMFKSVYLFFQIGYGVACLHANRCLSKISNLHFVIAGLCTVGSYLLWDRETYVYVSQMKLSLGNLGNITLRFFGAISSSVVFLYTCWHLFLNLPVRLIKFIARYGRKSIGIYILHSFLVGLLLWGLRSLGIVVQDNFFGFVLLVTATLIIAEMSLIFFKMLSGNKILGACLFGR